MITIDQNSAIASLNMALVPGPLLIDGRTEQDRLSFLADFAALINFYDNDNNINGNWTSFLLKDPVILLARISKTNFTKLNSLYLNTCKRIEAIVNANPIKAALIITIDQLFDQLTYVFMCIERWTYYMQKCEHGYNLKNYVIHQVRTVFSGYFWALIALRDGLSIIKSKHKIKAVKYYLFECFGELWKQDKDRSPFWEILGLQHPLSKNKPTDIYRALKKTGDELFVFFQTIIKHAATEFEKVKVLKSTFPDTTLIRAFVDLLAIHQEQLNTISQKHLQFYYNDILKQVKQPASPDSVFIFAELAKKDVVFELPAGTLFNAGVDAQTNPILFANREEVSLNPAVITGVYTLAKIKDAGNSVKFGLQAIANPGVIQKDEDGKVKSWKAFGDAASSSVTIVKPSLFIASPMLLLREGTRNIKFSFKFSQNADTTLFDNVSYYLSTQTAWVKVNGTSGFEASFGSKVISVDLPSTQQAVEPFLKSPDGLSSNWPLFKIEFDSFPPPETLPVIVSLTIAVTVSGVRTFQLYNDFGGLSAKTPYPLFGPTPLPGNSFIIGSNEIFSKPLQSLAITLNWNNLPGDFANYYQLYNDYLEGQFDPSAKNGESALKQFFLSAWIWLHLAKKPVPEIADPFFYNESFTAGFRLLQNSTWLEFDMANAIAAVPSPAKDSVTQPAGSTQVAAKTNYLFTNKPSVVSASTDSKGLSPAASTPKSAAPAPALTANQPAKAPPADSPPQMNDFTSFTYTFVPPPAGQPLSNAIAHPEIADPAIQVSPLKYGDTCAAGFMKMVLSGNPYGFGSQLYPQVVAQSALYNSWKLYNKDDKDPLLPPANLPFAPKLTSFTANYSSSQVYDFTLPSTGYPIQCFIGSPFANYLVYDNVSPSAVNSKAGIGANNISYDLSSFPSFSHDGFLFLEMDNLVPSNFINFYFELTPLYVSNTTISNKLGYYYLNKDGWQSLTVLADGTKNFSCSGVIKLNVPEDITNQSPLMPGNKFWFCITVDGDSGSVPQVALLKTNGFMVQRRGDAFLTAGQAPQIIAGTITKPQTAIPQIAAITQPFPSFGGKAADNDTQMNQRISNRLKTKDRAVTPGDYSALIKQQYAEIYYSKPVFNTETKNIDLYLVNAIANYTDAGAFAPMLTACKMEDIQAFLQEKVSGFLTIVVSNFNLMPVNITASISLERAFKYKDALVKKNIKDALDIFLSPWITSNQQQMAIDQGIDQVQVIKFIKSIDSVADVQNISFSSAISINNIPAGTLLVSGMDHKINVV